MRDINLETATIPTIPRKEGGSVGIYDPAKTDIFNQAAAETGLGVLVQPTEKTRWVSSDKPHEPAVELISYERNLSPFWKRVSELEAEAAKKVG